MNKEEQKAKTDGFRGVHCVIATCFVYIWKLS
jgi:hypothetical protein